MLYTLHGLIKENRENDILELDLELVKDYAGNVTDHNLLDKLIYHGIASPDEQPPLAFSWSRDGRDCYVTHPYKGEFLFCDRKPEESGEHKKVRAKKRFAVDNETWAEARRITVPVNEEVLNDAHTAIANAVLRQPARTDDVTHWTPTFTPGNFLPPDPTLELPILDQALGTADGPGIPTNAVVEIVGGNHEHRVRRTEATPNAGPFTFDLAVDFGALEPRTAPELTNEENRRFTETFNGHVPADLMEQWMEENTDIFEEDDED